jgi:hypothetical protein
MTTTFETLLRGLAILAVAVETHGTALVLGGLAAWILTHGGGPDRKWVPFGRPGPFLAEAGRTASKIKP